MKSKTASSKIVHRRTAAPMEPIRLFTVRDLNRQPKVVLNAARKVGGVHVRSRSGERFLIKLDPEVKSTMSDVESRRAFHARLEEMHARMREAGSLGITEEGWETFSGLIAGQA